ncbi:SDR family NAD(P)-dependent oxidoreductase [Rubrobacter marinus]|uniref:SDR family NAD(P)-dependent oxidoreductase n=1 Tax=Rubrobacter marinus TaxID=2653852 RepID=A0A6G8PTC5_9ACTN|nr:SDR family oxidoreductase [Rubrobacter marinus]QIN77216.1 SDR family NAD(P)-dependent oxidoreductase [Rubrobacter marinus]
MRQVEGSVMLVTGSTDGIGKETARRLAEMGATVLVHGRSRERGEEALEELREGTGNENLRLVVGDLSSMAQVRDLAEQVRSEHDGLDVLINNAGVVAEERTETEDGYELTFAVNHLAPFLLTNLLLDELRRAAPSRIITVSSIAHGGARIDFDDPNLRSGYSMNRAYARSKLANLLFTYELARRLEGTGVTANALHPGVIGTKLLATGFGGGGSSVESGAETSVYLATSPEVEGVTGKYFRGRREAESSPASHDEEAQRKLWELSERMVGLA